MKTRKRIGGVLLSLTAGTALLLGVTGCEKKSQPEPVKDAEMQEAPETERPAVEMPATQDPAQQKPKDHPAH